MFMYWSCHLIFQVSLSSLFHSPMKKIVSITKTILLSLSHSLVLCSWWPRRHLRLFTSFLSPSPRFPGSTTNDLSESQATSLAVKQQNTLIYSPTNISPNREVKEIITRIKGTGCCKTRRRLMSVIVRVRANADVEGLSRAMTEGGLWFMERIGSTLDFLRLQNREFESS